MNRRLSKKNNLVFSSERGMGGCPADTVRPKLFFHEPFPEQETVEPVFDTFYWEFKIFKCHISGTQIR